MDQSAKGQGCQSKLFLSDFYCFSLTSCSCLLQKREIAVVQRKCRTQSKSEIGGFEERRREAALSVCIWLSAASAGIRAGQAWDSRLARNNNQKVQHLMRVTPRCASSDSTLDTLNSLKCIAQIIFKQFSFPSEPSPFQTRQGNTVFC